ncbi:hypothetical protein BGY98DRAFT_977790 [Russula aff. rugulosa BPL654]|nr:hypothetical protein BGY98DRAFT_977790 [Russula aff. rugulosa BPL654]
MSTSRAFISSVQPLLDRMEVIEVSGYEKSMVAERRCAGPYRRRRIQQVLLPRKRGGEFQEAHTGAHELEII